MKFETFICGIVPFLVIGLLKSAFAEQQRQPSSEFLNELSIGLKNDWTYKLIEGNTCSRSISIDLIDTENFIFQ